jgi:hypothetical protein
MLHVCLLKSSMSNAVVALSIVTGLTAGGGGTLTEGHSSMIVARSAWRRCGEHHDRAKCGAGRLGHWVISMGRRLAKDVMKSSGRGRVMSIPSRLQRYDSREPSTPR